ncbi:hypothetical protein PHJA_002097000 [Phtheirospermum japonicum]|uniref:Uncharacterized protein n=1 Tax=Phtheirospermum japonicum TaxID=374723 RepID=A0A830CKL1_9LAMI|nr:hypothetical protein PHJA_002097000 [Phtheirospermum japonicum]
MAENFADERWTVANSTENTVELHEIGEDETEHEEDETLSLSDLPLIHKKEEEEEENSNNNWGHKEKEIQEDFDFCALSKEPEMCAADEVFFQGQILPLRHSVSSEKGLLLQYCKTRSISSSSISSRQSSSSGSSAGPKSRRPKLPPARNQFHSHPSPSPKINFPSKKNHYRNYNCAKKSSVWNIFRLGVLTPPPEIAFQDLKPRPNCRNFGSRNSTDSNGSSISCGNHSNTKKKNRSFLGGCKCSADAVDTVPTRVVSESELDALERENVEAMMKLPMKKQASKKHLSHHRTFEWLKQLSLEDAGD